MQYTQTLEMDGINKPNRSSNRELSLVFNIELWVVAYVKMCTIVFLCSANFRYICVDLLPQAATYLI